MGTFWCWRGAIQPFVAAEQQAARDQEMEQRLSFRTGLAEHHDGRLTFSDDDLKALPAELGDRVGDERNPALAGRGLLRDPDSHRHELYADRNPR